jgi:hypothetical protein
MTEKDFLYPVRLTFLVNSLRPVQLPDSGLIKLFQKS